MCGEDLLNMPLCFSFKFHKNWSNIKTKLKLAFKVVVVVANVSDVTFLLVT